ncbi:hypothetical protein CS022_14545 [Veronia nyctiphanis]|uniref:Uncharacterized protein n=1 Tax=Veronia nyctiphanis TaxID=1278244 RepID=A0A4Q0YPY8_9GAMM|nr:AsmA family protein [Veronia nyctiphanis]RXJ72653.1 hypothetical protein CS022_14545 [Veronia nyctiphanis]
MAIRFFLKFITILVVIALLLAGSVLAILHTQAGLPMFQLYLTWLTPYRLEAKEMGYSMQKPWTVTLSDLEVRNKSEPLVDAKFLSATLDPSSLITGPLELKNLTVSGTTIEKTLPVTFPEGLKIGVFAIENLTYRSDTLSLTDAKVQASDWHVDGNGRPDVLGSFQLEAPKAVWHKQTVSDLLVNSYREDRDWYIDGLSFELENASISSRAVWTPDDTLTISQLTVNNGRLQSEKNTQALLNNIQDFAKAHRIQVERLDILDLSADLTDWGLEHINLSAHNFAYENGQVDWLPDAGTKVSFNAALMRTGDYVMADAIVDLTISPDKVKISGLSARFQDGFVRLSGQASTDALSLDNLLISGVNLTFEPEEAARLQTWWNALNSVKVGQLTLKHMGLAVYDDNFPVFIEAVNARGSDLTLKHNGQTQMWQGELTADAALANINRIALMTPFFKMRSTEGLWQLDRATLSFKDGQGTAEGEIDLKSPSQKWQFKAEGLGIPTNIYQRWAGLDLPLSGQHDLSLSLSASRQTGRASVSVSTAQSMPIFMIAH